MHDRVTIWGYTVGWQLVRLLPQRLAYLLFSAIAQLAWLRQGRGVRQLEGNLARVVPGLSAAKRKALTRKAMHSYMRYYCDAFRLPGWSAGRITDTCRIVGDEPLRAALASGRGVVVALSHSGNWDHAGAWSTLNLAPVTTVAERLRPPQVYEKFLDFRQQLGMNIHALGEDNLFGSLVQTLRKGGFVPLLADRDLSATGVPVMFFGEAARMAAGPASLALVTGAALHPAMIYYERLARGSQARWGIVVEIFPEIRQPDAERALQLAQMTQEMADALARGIAAHPEDWHMLQRVFLSDVVPSYGPGSALLAEPGPVTSSDADAAEES